MEVMIKDTFNAWLQWEALQQVRSKNTIMFPKVYFVTGVAFLNGVSASMIKKHQTKGPMKVSIPEWQD